MPIYQFRCPDCGHEFSGMVMAGTQVPEKWVCSRCGGDRVIQREDCQPLPHPFESSQGSGCPCCGSGEKNVP